MVRHINSGTYVLIRSAFFPKFNGQQCSWALKRICRHNIFLNPSWFRRESTCRVNPVTCGEISILKPVRKSKNLYRATQRAWPDTRYGHTLRQGETIDILAIAQFVVRRHCVFMLRNTKPRRYDEQHNFLISEPDFSILCLNFWLVIRSALAEACLRAQFFFFSRSSSSSSSSFLSALCCSLPFSCYVPGTWHRYVATLLLLKKGFRCCCFSVPYLSAKTSSGFFSEAAINPLKFQEKKRVHN